MKKALVLLFAVLSASATGQPRSVPTDPTVETVDYEHDGEPLRGFLAVPESVTSPVPALVLVPDWDGNNFYEQVRTTMVAQEFGWVGFSADIYGVEYFQDDGLQVVEDRTMRGSLAGAYRSDPQLFASRIQAAVNYVKSLPQVDADRVAIAGYCFGGTGVLQYALMGMNDVQAVVSFHGGLGAVLGMAPPTEGVTPKVLVLSGGDDDASTEILDLEATLNNASATWEITRYSGIEHAFTVFEDDRYNAWADQRSWESMYHFLQETFDELVFVTQEPSSDLTQAVPYTDVDGTELLGHLALPTDEWARPLPAVVLLPDWDGVNDYERKRATVFADKGYVAFAADIYGADKQELEGDARGVEAGKYGGNTELFVQRIAAAVQYVRGLTDVDTEEIAVAGYCFGGNGIMQYSYAGKDDVKVAVAFHGSLTQLPTVTTDIDPYVLILSGGDDFLHGNQTELEASLNTANAEWEITRYSGVDHGFTKWDSGAYSLVADARSWESTMTVLQERLATPATAAAAAGDADKTVTANDPSSAPALYSALSICFAIGIGLFM